MADAQKRILSSEPIGKPDAEGYQQSFTTYVEYDEGGENVFTGKMKPRGYFLGATIETSKQDGIFTVRKFGMFDGTSLVSLIEPAKGFSAARLAKIVPDQDILARLRETVLAQNAENQEKALKQKALYEAQAKTLDLEATQ